MLVRRLEWSRLLLDGWSFSTPLFEVDMNRYATDSRQRIIQARLTILACPPLVRE